MYICNLQLTELYISEVDYSLNILHRDKPCSKSLFQLAAIPSPSTWISPCSLVFHPPAVSYIFQKKKHTHTHAKLLICSFSEWLLCFRQTANQFLFYWMRNKKDAKMFGSDALVICSRLKKKIEIENRFMTNWLILGNLTENKLTISSYWNYW